MQQGMDTNNRQLQVIHSRGDHWIVASTIFADGGQVNIYDSVYHAIDKATEVIISNLFGSLSIRLFDIEKQWRFRLWCAYYCPCFWHGSNSSQV